MIDWRIMAVNHHVIIDVDDIDVTWLDATELHRPERDLKALY